MNQSAEDYLRQAASYEKLAENERTSREQRILFAKKANWFHLLARLEEKPGASRDVRRIAVPEAMRPRQDGGRFRWVSRSLALAVHSLAGRLRG